MDLDLDLQEYFFNIKKNLITPRMFDKDRIIEPKLLEQKSLMKSNSELVNKIN